MSGPLDDAAAPSFVDFLHTVPAPLTNVLLGLAPAISTVRLVGDIISWRASWYDGWLAVAAWWAVCLLWVPVIRYLLPVALVGALALSRWTSPRRTPPPPLTEKSLQSVIADLITVRDLLPSLPDLLPAAVSSYALIRASLILSLPYLAVTHLVTLPTLLGIAGTLLLTYRAPWACTIRRTLWSSAHVRWTLYRSYALLSGTPLPQPSAQVPRLLEKPAQPPVNSIRLLFTVYENQRWWVGLDWTAALLPAERPSWCAPTLQPVSPPNAFSLPQETSVIVNDEKGRRVKRTARWEWEDTEWKVIVKKEAGSAAVRVERPLPKEKDDKEKEATAVRSTRTGSFKGEEGRRSEHEHANDDSRVSPSEEPVTDVDGWIYCGNKWEDQSNKSGIAKYTRYRRWTRVAVLYELVEILPPLPSTCFQEPVGIFHADDASSGSATAQENSPISPSTSNQSMASQSSVNSDPDRSGDGLKRRLKAALKAKS